MANAAFTMPGCTPACSAPHISPGIGKAYLPTQHTYTHMHTDTHTHARLPLTSSCRRSSVVLVASNMATWPSAAGGRSSSRG